MINAMRLLTTISLLLSFLLAYAVPAKRGWRTVRMTDGTERQVQLVGDEYFHCWRTAEGEVLRETENGCFAPSLQTVEPMRARIRRQQAAARQLVRRQSARKTAVGQKNGLVILMGFKDKAIRYKQTDFDDMFNKVNYNKNGHIGSLSDYFYDQSYGQLNLHFDVVGPYTSANKMSYYGENDESGNDLRAGDLIEEAIKNAHADGVNFAKYDWDSDGEVDQVYIVYAGYSEASGASDNTVWPHEWDLSSSLYYGLGGHGPMKYDGVTINTYACSSELMGTAGYTLDGIGTPAHEFSHCLGLPDFYDTSDALSPAPGMDAWSLMDYGCYNGNGCVPCGYTAYERWYSGWLEPVELNEGCSVKDMRPITETDEAYIIYNQANRNEYYILENHQKSHAIDSPYRSWDSQAYGHGMLVLHVDYKASEWEENTTNNVKSHQRMAVVPANGSFPYNPSNRIRAGHPYPGTSANTSLTNTTKPAASLFNRNSDGTKFLSRPIEDITEQNGLISFLFNGGGETSINAISVSQEKKDAPTYNLAGQRIAMPSRSGLYVIDNRVVLKR